MLDRFSNSSLLTFWSVQLQVYYVFFNSLFQFCEKDRSLEFVEVCDQMYQDKIGLLKNFWKGYNLCFATMKNIYISSYSDVTMYTDSGRAK